MLFKITTNEPVLLQVECL